MSHAAGAAKKKLGVYFDISSDACIVAIILDPRKTLAFYRDYKVLNEETRKTVEHHRDVARKIWEKEYGGESISQSQAQPMSHSPKSKIRKKARLTMESAGQGAGNTEFDRFLETVASPVPRSVNPLKWWNDMKTEFPTLFRMAMDYLAIPSSSASSERAFSQAHLVVTEMRTALCTDSARAHNCLKSWGKILDQV